MLYQGNVAPAVRLMLDSCSRSQVYTLEKVLVVKKDPVTQVIFLDEAMKVRWGTAHANLVLPDRTNAVSSWRTSPAARFGALWDNLWRSRYVMLPKV